MPKLQNKSFSRNKNQTTLSQKIEIILYHTNAKCSIRQLAKQFHIGKTSAGAIIRDQNKYLRLWKSNSTDDPSLKGFSPESDGLIIDKKVFTWYTQQKVENIPVTGTSLQKKALEIAKELGNGDFRASSGWLDAFKRRHNIIFRPEWQRKVRDEKYESLEDWETHLASLLSNYSPNDVYCAHETGLFYQALPEDTANLKFEICSCGKLPSQRLTVLLCSSMNGHKEPPLIITDIKNAKIENDQDDMPILQYHPMSWVTSAIMKKWLNDLNKKMGNENRKICLFMNRTETHKCVKLKNINLVYFPTNLFGEAQPMNHGIIQAFKTHYRLLMLQYLVSLKDYEEERTCDNVIDISKATSWIKSAWEVLSKSLIQRSFKSSGFEFQTISSVIEQSDTEPSLNEVAELLYAYDSDVNAVDYVNIDANLATEEEDAEQMEVLVDGNELLENENMLSESENMLSESENMLSESENLLLESENMLLESENGYEEDEMPISELIKKEAATVTMSAVDVVKSLKSIERFFSSQNDVTGVSMVNNLIIYTRSLTDDTECLS